MRTRAEQEWMMFQECFSKYKDKKIVLYGIGRGTANLLSLNNIFNIVGVMDKSLDNIGEIMFGLPVVSLEEAEKMADIIIINAPETYWETIYTRIQKSKIPVYFRNGKRAFLKKKIRLSQKEIEQKLNQEATDQVSKIIVQNILNELCISEMQFSTYYSFGYALWGPIVYAFCVWLYEKCKEKKIEELLFPSRDGYFLQKDFEYFIEVCKIKDAPISRYLLTSRRIANVASIETLIDFEKWCEFPFNGTVKEYMWNRFMIQLENEEYAQKKIQIPNDKNQIVSIIKEYQKAIKNNILRDKIIYREYLNIILDKDNLALIDIGYSGSIQRNLSKITNKNILGLYFVCDLSSENENIKYSEMYSCFQNDEDMVADQVMLYRRPQLLESMFTAPYGMVLSVDKDFKKICMPSSKNQSFFEEREKINEGIKKFILDMKQNYDLVSNAKELAVKVDRIFGILFSNVEVDNEIKKIFYWDDVIVQTRENEIFGE